MIEQSRVQRTRRYLSERQPLTFGWAQLQLKRTEQARWQRREPCCLREYLTLLQWRTSQVPTCQSKLMVRGGTATAFVCALHGAAGTACTMLRIQRCCPHLGSAALTTWFHLTNLRETTNNCRLTIDGLLCSASNKV